MLRYTTVFFFVATLFITSWSFAQGKNQAEVIHWWVTGSEGTALKVVADSFESKGYTWLDTPVKASYQAKSVAISRILDNAPPTMVQWHAGLAVDELYQEGLIRDLDSLFKKNGWYEVIPQVLLKHISVKDKVVAIPLTLHGSNWMWTNRSVVKAAKIEMPTSWDQFIEIAPLLQQQGIIPLAVGGQPWQLRLLFNNVLLGVGGAALYEEIMIRHNPEAIESAAMVKVLDTFGQLREFIDPESNGRGWSETTKLVIDGKAAFQIMGDWAKGEFIQAGKSPEKDFGCSFSPGTAGAYLIVSDVFVAPVTQETADIELQEELAETMMYPDVQRQFNVIKGSIPPRVDIPTEGFDRCSAKAMEAVAGGAEIIPGFNMTNKGVIGNILVDGIAQYWRNPEQSPQDAANQLAEAIRGVREE